METVQTGRPVVESSSSAVSWGPIIVGAIAAVAATLILMLLGAGLGLSVISPWSMRGVSATTFAVSAAVWLIIVQWLSSALGGYLTGRLRTRWVGVHDDEVFFRDTAHGFLAWALATVVITFVVGSGLTSAVSSGVQAASTVASGAALGAGSQAAGSGGGTAENATGYFVDSLFRPANPSPTAPEDRAAATAEATRILLMGVTSGEIPAEDRAYLVMLVGSRTGLSQADAEGRVNAVLQRIADTKAKAKEAADTARKAGLTLSLVASMSLLIGAFIAAVAACVGGNERDRRETLIG